MNARTFAAQVFRILDEARTVIRYNSEWLGPMGFEDVLRLASRHTVARMLERDDFRQRYTSGSSISIHELLYPLTQAYDSVALKSDVELGGTDQTFNLLVGRDIQRDAGQAPQQILTCELLVGLDGEKKMSKSLGNAIGLTDPPYEQYARAMSISDELMPNWAGLVTRWEDAEITAFATELAGGSVHPKLAKQRLAAEIVSRWHGDAAAAEAASRWQDEVSAGEAAADTPDHSISASPAGLDLLDLLVGAGLARSRGEARRLVGQGGVRLDGVVLADERQRFQAGDQHELRVGKRSAARVTLTD